MHVLVTGGAGFIGQHLVRALLARGDRVRVLDNFDDAYDPALKAEVPGSELVRGDVGHPPTVRAALAGVDAVVHLAARAGVRESLADPERYARVNVAGTATLAAAMADLGVHRMVFASSSSVYGAAPGPFREEDRADRPASPYAASKRAAELFLAASGLDVTVARLFTVYGPGQRPGMAIARFVRLARAGEPIPVYGDGDSRRDYTWVEDTVDGLLRGLDRADGYRVVNLGGGRPVSLRDVLAAVAAATGRPLRLLAEPPQPGDVPATHADLTLAREWLGWEPKTAFSDGIRRYVASCP
jgi:UDP-glucuronate 4-epimerase